MMLLHASSRVAGAGSAFSIKFRVKCIDFDDTLDCVTIQAGYIWAWIVTNRWPICHDDAPMLRLYTLFFVVVAGLRRLTASARSDPSKLLKLTDSFRVDVDKHLAKDGKGVVLASAFLASDNIIVHLLQQHFPEVFKVSYRVHRKKASSSASVDADEPTIVLLVSLYRVYTCYLHAGLPLYGRQHTAPV